MEMVVGEFVFHLAARQMKVLIFLLDLTLHTKCPVSCRIR